MKGKLEDFLCKNGNKSIVTLLILGAIFNDLVLRSLTTGGILFWKPLAASMSIILFVYTLTLFLSGKNRRKIFISLSWFFGLLNAANYLYYQHYKSFISISILRQLKHLKDLKGSLSSTIDLKVIIFLLPSIFLHLVLRKTGKVKNPNDSKYPRNKKEICRPLILGLLTFIIVATSLTPTDFNRLSKQWNRPYIVEQLGIYSYTVADLTKYIFTPNRVSAIPSEEVINILDELIEDNMEIENGNKYTNMFKGKDIYIIHYESAQSFAINREFSDGPVTPFLNKLTSEGLYFDNFYPQHSVGTSSDSEFTFNTSLLPINNGTVFMTHSDREFVTLGKLLKKEGYYTMSMHGNNGDFWNRNIMHESLGYDRFYSQDDYIIDEEIGLGLSDLSFFRQSVEKIKDIKKEKNIPIMATLITLTNHYPFDEIDKYGEFNVDHLEGSEIGNYFKSFHYADRALESFFNSMDREGLLDNALLVLYGDHHAKIPLEDFEKLYNYNEMTGEYYTDEDMEYIEIDEVLDKQLKRTPFLIWSKDHQFKETIDTPMGMLDALPTLSNMLGIFNPYQLGTDIMSIDKNTVIFPNGSWLNDKFYYSASSSTYYSLTGEEVEENPDLISISEFVEEKIEISNSIIHGDLIREFKNLAYLRKRDKKTIDEQY